MAASEISRDPDLEWLDHIKPTGLVISPTVIKERGLVPERQTQIDTAEAAAFLNAEDGPALADPWAFVEDVLGWQARYVVGAPGGPALPDDLAVSVPEHETVLVPDWAVQGFDADAPWQLLVQLLPPKTDPDKRAAIEGWEATQHQRFERLLRETGVNVGVLITHEHLRLIYAPAGETSGWLSFPLRSLAGVAGRPMLAGLKLLQNDHRLFQARSEVRLKALLKESREAQAAVSIALAGQVLGALHELLRGLYAAEPNLIADTARNDPRHLYDGLLTALMRLVFLLYAEDRDLIPSRNDAPARNLYDDGYSVRGLFGKLTEDAALNPDTMEERYGGWGRLLALFRLIHAGHASGFVTPRGGKLFDPDVFPFLEGRADATEPPRVVKLTDGCLLRILESLMTVQEPKTRVRQRLSYRTLDVEQIGSVYETVMGFTVQLAPGRVLAIRAGKNNRTPVFADLDHLASLKATDRAKYLRDECKRAGTLGKTVDKPLKDAADADAIAAALESIVDLRGAPGKTSFGAGTPILQPTEERRRAGGHYTPRTLTEPIVRQALETAFDRLGEGATPEQILTLKVCDPAMGSGAFLVEACRKIAQRLVKAWAEHPGSRPAIPPDEDEELHARRLVAQRCLYGVDKDPRAVDLARLSLWLATLARDHEFTFLDHALKCGDSLVGLTPAQIAAANWDESKPGLPLFRQLVRDRVTEAEKARAEIQSAPDDTMRAIQEARHKHVENRLSPVRLMGDSVISAFFAADKARARESARAEVESHITGMVPRWDLLEAASNKLRSGDHGIPPFHWAVEFPEVFVRENGGFDAIVGNPPFAGKNTISNGNPKNYLQWLQTFHEGAHGNSDLVAHFFRRSFALLRDGGAFGLIATNTIGQGDTRESGLTKIIADGGAIARATRRLKWPGEAAVVVSVVHVLKGEVAVPVLDGHAVSRISAYLVEGDLDISPKVLVANSRKAFQGSIVLGIGFTFDDKAAEKGEAESLETMQALVEKDVRNARRIRPFIGGEEVTNSPTQAHHRFVIDFFDRPLHREPKFNSWFSWSDERQQRALREGVVPLDYPDKVAEDWPDLIEIVRRRVKPDRDSQKRDAIRNRWWQYAEKRPGLYNSIASLDRVFVTSAGAARHHMISSLPTSIVLSHKLIVFSVSSFGAFCVLHSRAHENWSSRFGGTRGVADDLTYNPTDVFATFPFPQGFESDAALEAVGEIYHAFRAELMIDRDEGLTKTYNRFHDRGQNASDIARLRTLHAEMDTAVLRAYGWDELAEQANPEFIEQDADEGKQAKTRLDWPAEFKDEVLARLLALNAERHEEEVGIGLATRDGKLVREAGADSDENEETFEEDREDA